MAESSQVLPLLDLLNFDLDCNYTDFTKPLVGDKCSLDQMYEEFINGKEIRDLIHENPNLFLLKGATILKLLIRFRRNKI
jgi:hypothetical protein